MDPETTKKRKKSRLRSANWTVSQTRLLLKLMKKKQQELGEENFDGEVWHQITVALNKKSRPSRKIDQVKMRIKTLKGEFNDYRMFVQKPGWGWDSKRKLPIAPSERCWDEIIESNKRLSKCRTKAFPWYKLVAELSGAEVPAGENEPSGSTNDAMEEENLLLPGAGTEQSAGANSADDVSSSSGKRTRDELVPVVLEEDLLNNSTDAEEELPEVGITQTKKRVRNANWTDQQTSVLLDLLLEKHELGITEYTEDCWKELCKDLNEKTQPHRSVRELRMRLKTLKADFSDYRFCAETWGWYWDNEKGLPVGPNEACWDEITKINKKVERCRGKPFWWYEQIAKLCNKNPETEHHKLSWHPTRTVKETSNPQLLPLNSPEAYTEQSNNSAGGTPLSAGTESGRLPRVRERNTDRTKGTPKQMEHPNKRLEDLADATPSIYKEATNNFKLVAKKLVKVRSQFKLSRSDFIDMSVVVRDELNRELFMEQEGKELLDWIKDSLETYREQRKAQQGMQQSANRPFFMPVYPYPPGGPYTPQPPM
ncbi:Myb/SANT-like DNA-binding domain-containing protein [Carex littledalei]|uniref:Myb/SANT-like DNA-binding domain-containing protein n=1 Tax=Carex littledalei TaxID=544730 RepID=A0A833V436_9POAL|nr:Myb/SANT-like DNA-binding domain-containing protein [Carex littledalei]